MAMDKIFDNINDPSWWFTAVLVAIIASLFAAYIKDFLGRMIAHVSVRYGTWRKAQEERKHERALRTASDPARLIILLILVFFRGAIFLFFFIAFFVFPLWAGFIYNSPDFLPLMFFNSKTGLPFAKWATIAIGIFTALTGYKVSLGMSDFMRAYEIYVHKDQKEKVWDNKTRG